MEYKLLVDHSLLLVRSRYCVDVRVRLKTSLVFLVWLVALQEPHCIGISFIQMY